MFQLLTGFRERNRKQGARYVSRQLVCWEAESKQCGVITSRQGIWNLPSYTKPWVRFSALCQTFQTEVLRDDTDSPETSVRNGHFTLRKISEERWSQIIQFFRPNESYSWFSQLNCLIFWTSIGKSKAVSFTRAPVTYFIFGTQEFRKRAAAFRNNLTQQFKLGWSG